MNDKRALEVLACQFELRPRGVPGIDAIVQAALEVEREGQRTLAVSFDGAAASDVEAFAAAERRCCPTLSWTFEQTAGAARLTIGAEPAQIDLLERLFGRRV